MTDIEVQEIIELVLRLRVIGQPSILLSAVATDPVGFSAGRDRVHVTASVKVDEEKMLHRFLDIHEFEFAERQVVELMRALWGDVFSWRLRRGDDAPERSKVL